MGQIVISKSHVVGGDEMTKKKVLEKIMENWLFTKK